MCFGIDGPSEAAPRAQGARAGAAAGKGRRAARRRKAAGGLPAAKLDQLAAEMRALRGAMLAERKRRLDELVADSAARGDDADRRPGLGDGPVGSDRQVVPPGGAAVVVGEVVEGPRPGGRVRPDRRAHGRRGSEPAPVTVGRRPEVDQRAPVVR